MKKYPFIYTVLLAIAAWALILWMWYTFNSWGEANVR
jgi:hypothetical protein